MQAGNFDLAAPAQIIQDILNVLRRLEKAVLVRAEYLFVGQRVQGAAPDPAEKISGALFPVRPGLLHGRNLSGGQNVVREDGRGKRFIFGGRIEITSIAVY